MRKKILSQVQNNGFLILNFWKPCTAGGTFLNQIVLNIWTWFETWNFFQILFDQIPILGRILNQIDSK